MTTKPQPAPPQSAPPDVIIVGAGAAALACATHLRRDGVRVVVLCNAEEVAESATSAVRGRWLGELPWLCATEPGLRIADSAFAPAVAADEFEAGVRVELADGSSLTARYLVLDTRLEPRSDGLLPRPGLYLGAPEPTDPSIAGVVAAVLGGGESALRIHSQLLAGGAQSVTVYARTLRAAARFVRPAEQDIVLGPYEVSEAALEVNGLPFDRIHVSYGCAVPRRALLGLMVGVNRRGFAIVDSFNETTASGVFAVGAMTGNTELGVTGAFAEGQRVALELRKRLDGPYLATVIGGLLR